MSQPRVRGGLLLAMVSAGVVALIVFLRPWSHAPVEPGVPGSEAAADDSAVSAALASRAVERLQDFRRGRSGVRLSLTADEVTSLLRHAVPGMLPSGVSDPRIRLEDGSLAVEARLATADFAGMAPLASVLGALPDTIDIDLLGRLDGTPGALVFVIERARASGVPLPRGVVAAVAAELVEHSGDRIVTAGADEAALGLRWPTGVAGIAVRGDRLVLDRGERIVDRAVDGSDP